MLYIVVFKRHALSALVIILATEKKCLLIDRIMTRNSILLVLFDIKCVDHSVPNRTSMHNSYKTNEGVLYVVVILKACSALVIMLTTEKSICHPEACKYISLFDRIMTKNWILISDIKCVDHSVPK